MSPLDAQDILERARGGVRVGDYEEAERLLKSYLAKNPEDRDAHLLLGTSLAKKGALEEAEDEFITLVSRNDQDVEALNNLAVVYRRADKLHDALGKLLEAIDIDPTRAEFHYNIGNIHKQLGNLKAASMAYAKVVELDQNFTPAYNNLGSIYEELKDYDKAYNIFRKGLLLDRNNPTLHYNYGVALEANNRFDDAVNEYKAAIRSKPGWLKPVNRLGNTLAKQGKQSEALAVFSRALQSEPNNVETLSSMGAVQADMGRHEEAISSFRQALEQDPAYVKAAVNLERSLEATGNSVDAMVELEKLIRLVPDSAEVRNRLAGIYLKMERYSEAEEQVKVSLEKDPKNVQSLKMMGALQRVLGDDKSAQRTFERILEVDPGNYSFLMDLADIHFRRKEYKEAEERLVAFLSRKPRDRQAKIALGRLYAEMGNRTQAIITFDELAREDPTDTEALSAMAELHKDAGSLEKALRTADTLVNLQGGRATSEDLSDLNKSLDFYEKAVKEYSSSVQDMWERNIKLMKSGLAEESPETEEDIQALFSAGESTLPFTEDQEELFIEDLTDYEDEDETPLDGEYFPWFDTPAPDRSLDSLATPEPAPPFQPPPPQGGHPVAPQNPSPPVAPPQTPAREEEPRYPIAPPPIIVQMPPPMVPQNPSGGSVYFEEYPEEISEYFDPLTESEEPAFEDGEAELPTEAELPSIEELSDDIEELPPYEDALAELEDEESEAELEDLVFDEAEEPFLTAQAALNEEFPLEDLDNADEMVLFEESSFGDPPPEEVSDMEALDEAFDEFALEEIPEEEAFDEFTLEEEPVEEAVHRLSYDDLKYSAILGLLRRLRDLAMALPQEKRIEFMVSDVRLGIEYCIERLEGKKGLYRNMLEKEPWTSDLEAAGGLESPEPQEVESALSYLESLTTAFLPDQDLSVAINRRVDGIIEKIRQSRDPHG